MKISFVLFISDLMGILRNVLFTNWLSIDIKDLINDSKIVENFQKGHEKIENFELYSEKWLNL